MKKLSLILLGILCASGSFGQFFYYDDKYYDNDILYEGGLSIGLMNAVADVGERKSHGLNPSHYDWKSMQISMGVYFGILYKSTVEGRIEITKGTAAGKDANSNSAYVRSRNLNFKSSILEVAVTGAFHPLMLSNSEYLPSFSPYLLAGVSVFSFYPKTLYNGEYIPLRRENTEGQNSEQYPGRKQYSLRALSLPVGLGVKYEWNAKFNVRLEGLYRFTNTDYLDDASTTYVEPQLLQSDLSRMLAHRYLELNPNEDRTGQRRGKATNKDNFFNISLKVGYVLGRTKIPINYAPKS